MRAAGDGAVELGLIEGFYGLPWSPLARDETITFLSDHGYGFYIYAPKADAYLRKRWREHFPEEDARHLRDVSERCRELGVRFGVGLSPYEIYRSFDAPTKADLARKLAELDVLGVQDLAILFDDMRGDLPGLARGQLEILDWIGGRTSADRLIFCPTYYSDDPVLERVFGAMPAGYLEDLGAGLDPSVEVFWTGEEVCSRAYGVHHLERVAASLRRPPVIWDNYPVNDGPVMSRSLHLRAFTGRPAEMASVIRAHAVNPASQAVLSRIPALTLAESYCQGQDYDYGAAFARAADTVLGPDLAAQVRGDISQLQDAGLDRLGDKAKARLRERYAAFDHPGALEIVAWLDGVWTITRAEMET